MDMVGAAGQAFGNILGSIQLVAAQILLPLLTRTADPHKSSRRLRANVNWHNKKREESLEFLLGDSFFIQIGIYKIPICIRATTAPPKA
jgi:hypothetical protein